MEGKFDCQELRIEEATQKQLLEAGFQDVFSLAGKRLCNLQRRGVKIDLNDMAIWFIIAVFLARNGKEPLDFIICTKRGEEGGDVEEDWGDADAHVEILRKIGSLRSGRSVSIYRNIPSHATNDDQEDGLDDEFRKIQKQEPQLSLDEEELVPEEEEAIEEILEEREKKDLDLFDEGQDLGYWLEVKSRESEESQSDGSEQEGKEKEMEEDAKIIKADDVEFDASTGAAIGENPAGSESDIPQEGSEVINPEEVEQEDPWQGISDTTLGNLREAFHVVPSPQEISDLGQTKEGVDQIHAAVHSVIAVRRINDRLGDLGLTKIKSKTDFKGKKRGIARQEQSEQVEDLLPGVGKKSKGWLKERFGDNVYLKELSDLGQNLEGAEIIWEVLHFKGQAINTLNRAFVVADLPVIPSKKEFIKRARGLGENQPPKPRKGRPKKEGINLESVPVKATEAKAPEESITVLTPLLQVSESEFEAVIKRVLGQELRPHVEDLEELAMRLNGLITDVSKLALFTRVLGWLSQGNTEAKLQLLESLMALDAGV